MTARQYLSRAFWLDKRIEKRAEELERLRAQAERVTTVLTGMPRGGSGGDWTALAVRIMERQNVIRGEIEELCRVKREIAAVIDAVEDNRYRTLLELRYRNYLSFEKIAVEMNYSWRQVIRIHQNALKVVKIPDGEE